MFSFLQFSFLHVLLLYRYLVLNTSMYFGSAVFFFGWLFAFLFFVFRFAGFFSRLLCRYFCVKEVVSLLWRFPTQDFFLFFFCFWSRGFVGVAIVDVTSFISRRLEFPCFSLPNKIVLPGFATTVHDGSEGQRLCRPCLSVVSRWSAVYFTVFLPAERGGRLSDVIASRTTCDLPTKTWVVSLGVWFVLFQVVDIF